MNRDQVIDWISLLSLCIESKNVVAIDEIIWDMRRQLEQYPDSTEYKTVLALESLCTRLSKLFWFDVIKNSN